MGDSTDLKTEKQRTEFTQIEKKARSPCLSPATSASKKAHARASRRSSPTTPRRRRQRPRRWHRCGLLGRNRTT